MEYDGRFGARGEKVGRADTRREKRLVRIPLPTDGEGSTPRDSARTHTRIPFCARTHARTRSIGSLHRRKAYCFGLEYQWPHHGGVCNQYPGL